MGTHDSDMPLKWCVDVGHVSVKYIIQKIFIRVLKILARF